jgi:glycine hydroxymethyltransferase
MAGITATSSIGTVNGPSEELKPIPLLFDWFASKYRAYLEYVRSQLSSVDPTVYDNLLLEIRRQSVGVNLVGSESLPDTAVMASSAAFGYVQTIEGRTGKRWYPFTDGIDAIERTGEERAKALFGFPQANLQPHSATQANQAVYLTSLRPGDTILTAAFTTGAHLSHGFGASFARRFYNIETYEVPSFDSALDLDDLEQRIIETRPSLIIAGCSAYPREIPFGEIRNFAHKYGARFLADISHTAGFIAAELHGPPKGADFCSMSLHKTMCGPRGGVLLTTPQYKNSIDRAVFPGVQGAVFPNVIAAKTICLGKAAEIGFKCLQTRIIENAQAMAEALLQSGVRLFTGGTDSHLLILQRDPTADARTDVENLLRIGLLTNANYVHGDELGRNRMSGIRIGTTWMTQVGFHPQHATRLGSIIANVLQSECSNDQDRQMVISLVEDVIGK